MHRLYYEVEHVQEGEVKNFLTVFDAIQYIGDILARERGEARHEFKINTLSSEPEPS